MWFRVEKRALSDGAERRPRDTQRWARRASTGSQLDLVKSSIFDFPDIDIPGSVEVRGYYFIYFAIICKGQVGHDPT